MSESVMYLFLSAISMISITVAYYEIAFTNFTMPFFKVSVGKEGSLAILCLICAACFLLHKAALKRKWMIPGAWISITMAALPVTIYSLFVFTKYSFIFAVAVIVAVIVSCIEVKLMHKARIKIAEKVQTILSVWVIFLSLATFFTLKDNDTQMMHIKMYSSTVGADNGLVDKLNYSTDKIDNMLPDIIYGDVPFVVKYSYLSADEKIVIDGLYIRVSVQYAEQVGKEELYASIRQTLHENRPINSSLMSGSVISC